MHQRIARRPDKTLLFALAICGGSTATLLAACGGPLETTPAADCTKGDVRCLGLTRQACSDQGRWTDQEDCTILCIDAKCTGDCHPGVDKQCSGLTPQTCGVDGQWVNGDDCPFLCGDGECSGSCKPGAAQCMGLTPQTCGDDGQWVDGAPCPILCNKGECTGVCTPGVDKQCSGLIPQTCGDDGQWVDGAPCPFLCDGGVCGGVCKPGVDKRCVGGTVQSCDALGQWVDESVCPPCQGCNNAAVQCMTNQADGSSCDDASLCTVNDTCTNGVCAGMPNVVCATPDPCGTGACDPATGACAPLADGSACNDNGVCSSMDTCQGGLCNPSADNEWTHFRLDIPPPNPRFTATADVVVDTLTGLLWQRHLESPLVPKDWATAKAYCAGLSIKGYPSGWRMPTRLELVSIVDYTVATSPAIDGAFFLDTPAGGLPAIFWSSTLKAKILPADADQAWAVFFLDGSVQYPETASNPLITLSVRCVR